LAPTNKCPLQFTEKRMRLELRAYLRDLRR